MGGAPRRVGKRWAKRPALKPAKVVSSPIPNNIHMLQIIRRNISALYHMFLGKLFVCIWIAILSLPLGCVSTIDVSKFQDQSHFERLDAISKLDVDEVGELIPNILPYEQVETRQLLQNASSYQYNHESNRSIIFYNVYATFEVLEWCVDTIGYGQNLKDSLLSMDDYVLINTKSDPNKIETFRSNAGDILYRFTNYELNGFNYPYMFQFTRSD